MLDELETAYRQFSRFVSSQWSRYAAPPVTPSQAWVLEILEERGKQKAGQLADVMNVTCGAVTGLVDKLSAEGYVVRVRAEEDRRIVYVSITESGRAVLEHVRNMRKDITARLFSCLTEEEQRQLARMFRKIAASRDNGAENGG